MRKNFRHILLCVVAVVVLAVVWFPDGFRKQAGSQGRVPSPRQTLDKSQHEAAASGGAPVSSDAERGEQKGVARDKATGDKGSVMGTVVSDEGEALSGAEISIFWRTIGARIERKPPDSILRTDSRGLFPVPADGYPLAFHVSHPRFAPVATIVPARSPVRISLRSGVQHQGIVIDAETEAPLQDARVSLAPTTSASADKELDLQQKTVTAPDGRFFAGPLSADSPVLIRVEHPEFATYTEYPRTLCSKECDHIIRLVRPARLIVEVATPGGGAPPRGGNVLIVPSNSTGEKWPSARIDAAGTARIERLVPGMAEVWASAPGHLAGRLDTVLRSGENALSLILGEGREVTGRVIDEESGSPVPGASVSLAETRLHPATENLPRIIDPSSLPPESVRELLSAFERLEEMSQEEINKLGDLLVGGVDEDGNVVGDDVQFAVPATEDRASSWQDLNGFGFVEATATQSDSEGYFSLVVPRPSPPGLEVQAWADGYWERTIAIPREESVSIEIALAPFLAEPVVVEGRVVDEDGQPVAGAVARTSTSASTTDSNGGFRLELEPGYSYVWFHAEGFVTRRMQVGNFDGPPAPLDPLRPWQDVTHRIESLRKVRLEKAVLVKGRLEPPPWRGEIVTVRLLSDILAMNYVSRYAAVVGWDGRFVLTVPSGRQDTLVVTYEREEWRTDVTLPTTAEEVVLGWRAGR